MPAAGEIYIEYLELGGMTRAVAVDAATGTEVTVFGPASVPHHDIGRIAVRKLDRRLAAGRTATRRADGAVFA